MKKILIIVIMASLFMVSKGYSQRGGYMSFQYAVSFGTGDMGDYISAPSFRGALMEYRNVFTENIHGGIDVGWNVFYEDKDAATYTDGTRTIYGKQYRTQNQVPLLAAVDYYFSPDGSFKPYVGLGIGTMYSERSTDMNLYRLEENPWHFTLKPEVGFTYELSFNTSWKFAAKYYTGFAAGELESQSFLSISTGLTFVW